MSKVTQLSKCLNVVLHPSKTSLARRGIHRGIAPISSEISNAEIRSRRNKLFQDEADRQRSLIPRLENIEVEFIPLPEEKAATIVMHKGISTPMHVAQHIHKNVVDRSVVALVNDTLWDMHRPLEEDCKVKFLHFQTNEDPFHVNRAFWRSCSFMLGDALENLFQKKIVVDLHSFPAPNVNSGSFVHDVDLKFSDWKPTKLELMSFSAYLHRLSEKEIPFERLVVNTEKALEMFANNPYKVKQIPSIAETSNNGDSVTLYRMGKHVDISRGPMISNTSFLGRRCTIAAAHPIQHNGVNMYRFQGVALPKGINLDNFAFGVLEKRAQKLNSAGILSTITPS